MRKIRVVQILTVICAMWAAVWLSDGDGARCKGTCCWRNYYGACIGDVDNPASNRRAVEKES